jgi:multiple sugar transport system substrate-binding protein
MAMLEKAKSKGIQGMWTSALSVYGLDWQTLVYQYGGKMINDDGASVGWGGAEGTKALTLVQESGRPGLQPRERRS